MTNEDVVSLIESKKDRLLEIREELESYKDIEKLSTEEGQARCEELIKEVDSISDEIYAAVAKIKV